MPFKDPAKYRAMQNQYNRIKKEKGLCVKCGKALGEGASKTLCAVCKETLRVRSLDYRAKLRDEVYAAYGGAVCACCGETEPLFLTIDHINGGGTKHRASFKSGGAVFNDWLRKNKFPPGYQVLCQNCNTGKHRNGGICPHKR